MSDVETHPMWHHINNRCLDGCLYCHITKIEAENATLKAEKSRVDNIINRTKAYIEFAQGMPAMDHKHLKHPDVIHNIGRQLGILQGMQLVIDRLEKK